MEGRAEGYLLLPVL